MSEKLLVDRLKSLAEEVRGPVREAMLDAAMALSEADTIAARLAEAESVIEAVATMYNGNPAKYAEAVSNAHSLADDYVMKYLSGADSAPAKPRHICGAQGYNPMIDPPCPACTPDSASVAHNRRWSDGEPEITVHTGYKEKEVARMIRDHQKIIDAKRKSCPRCYGKSPLCHRCQGTGMIDAPTSADDPSCPECDGEGHE